MTPKRPPRKLSHAHFTFMRCPIRSQQLIFGANCGDGFT